jgi:ADP-heptose:LPS heptosyltransferase
VGHPGEPPARPAPARSSARGESSGLFVELLGGFGDLLFALPALDALVQSDRETAWDVVTFSPGSELLATDPRFRDVFTARSGPPKSGEDYPPCWHDLSTRLAATRYDVVVCDARHSGLSELVETSGVYRTITQLWSGTTPSEPISALFLRRLREEGLIRRDAPEPAAKLHLTASEQSSATELWNSLDVASSRAVVLNPNAGMTIKRWRDECFVQLGTRLRRDGWEIVVLAGDATERAAAIAARVPNAVVVPRVSLRLTAACLATTALLVSADSGIAHLAGSVGTPVVGIYGPTWAGRYGARSPSRNVQSPFVCPELRPMNFTEQRCWYSGQCIFSNRQSCCDDVSVEAVFDAARDLLATTTSPESCRAA